MGRYRRTTSSAPLAVLAGLLLLIGVSHCRAAARPLPPSPPLLHHLHGNGVKDAADVPVLQEGVAGNGDEFSTSEMMGGAEEVDEEAMASCEEGDDECIQQRRLLRDAHLDYIYTQHKGKP